MNANGAGFTREQWMILTVIGSVHFGCAICISLQAPFYPHEVFTFMDTCFVTGVVTSSTCTCMSTCQRCDHTSHETRVCEEKKGASATEYGLVFGIFELVSFITSPIMGKYMYRTGPRAMLNSGIFAASSCSILFGLLDLVSGHVNFIALSFAIRIIEAVGASAATTAAFALTAAIFPDSVATTFATLEIFYGLGYIVGPLIGGVLYSIGGYIAPFAVMGLFLMLDAVFIYWLLPCLQQNNEQHECRGSLTGMLRIPDITLDAFCIVCAAISMGFLTATLEPHIRMFNLPPTLTGVVFVISGTLYAVSAPVIGRMCDSSVHPKKMIVFGSFCIMLSYFLVGPMPGVPLPKTLWMCIIGLIVHGLGSAAILVPCFSDILNSAYERGFANDFSTFGMVSGIWAAAFSLGAFIGPSVAGLLYDIAGFQIATLFPVGVQFYVFLVTIGFIWYKSKSLKPVTKPPLDLENPSKQNGHHHICNLPQDIPPLSSKCNDNIRPTGYGSFSAHNAFVSIVR